MPPQDGKSILRGLPLLTRRGIPLAVRNQRHRGHVPREFGARSRVRRRSRGTQRWAPNGILFTQVSQRDTVSCPVPPQQGTRAAAGVAGWFPQAEWQTNRSIGFRAHQNLESILPLPASACVPPGCSALGVLHRAAHVLCPVADD